MYGLFLYPTRLDILDNDLLEIVSCHIAPYSDHGSIKISIVSLSMDRSFSILENYRVSNLVTSEHPS